MRQTALGFFRRVRRVRVAKHHPHVLRLSSLACCLNSSDFQQPDQGAISSHHRSQCVVPLVTVAVRSSNWDVATKISFRECVRLYGISSSIRLFAVLIRSFLPARTREMGCLIQSVTDYCGNAGPDLFRSAPILVGHLGGLTTLPQVYAAVIWIFVESLMFEDALITYLEAKNVGVELQLCNFLLKCLVERKQMMYARSLFDDAFELCKMETNGVRPNAATYGTFLYGLCRARQVMSAWNFLQMLYQKGRPCNHYCFDAVIHGFCNEGQVHKAIEVLDEMKKCGFAPDAHSYSILVDGFCKQGDLLASYDVLVEMASNGINPTLVSYSSLLHGLSRTGKMELAFELFKWLKDQGFKHDQIIYIIILDGCCQHLDLEFAYDLWNDMIHHNFVPDIYNYTSLIYAFCRHRYLNEALGLFELMLENGISPNIVTCTILIDGFIKEGLISEAFLLLNKICQLGVFPNLYTYKVIINGLCKVNKSNDVWEIFADMIKRSFVPDVVYSIIIGGFVKALKLEEAFKLYHRMLDEGTTPNIFTYTSLDFAMMIDFLK